MFNFFKEHPALSRVAIAGIAFLAIVLGFSLYRYYAFFADSDHGIFSQVFWNSTYGRFFQSSVSAVYSVDVTQDGDVPSVFYRRLAQHFTPALLLWVPLYAIFPSPVTLVVLKVVLITAAGPVLYVLSRHYLNPLLSSFITISFYGANTVIGPVLNEFYDFCQIPLFTFGMLLALEKRRWWIFALLGFLILLVREDAGLVPFGIGVYLIISRRYPRIGLAVCAASFLYMLLVTTVFMPFFTDEVGRRFMVEEFGQFTGDQKASTVDVIESIVRQPWLILKEFVTPFDKIVKYILGHLLPLAFVPVISPPAWMISGFPLLENLLRKEDGPLSINIRYTTPIVPGLFYGAILWWSQHQDRFKPLRMRRFWALCISLSLLFTITSNPGRAWSFLIPDSIQPWIYVSAGQRWDHANQVRSLLQQIPPDASIAASRYIIPHLANRRALLRFPNTRYCNDSGKVRNVEYIMLDFQIPIWYRPAYRTSREELQTNYEVLNQIIQGGRYGMVDLKDGVVLMRRRTETNPTAWATWQVLKQQIDSIL
jgi:uncharacterized membrane protein